ncbi:MAG: hypothetical protein ACHREM_11810 [Polyangiales bacterium]
MNDAQLTAIIIGITGVLRTRFPKIHGLVVPGVAIVVGAVLAPLNEPDAWRAAIAHGVGVALAAVGGMTAIGYAGTKVGGGVAAANGSATSDSTSTGAPHAPPHGEHERSRSSHHRS